MTHWRLRALLAGAGAASVAAYAPLHLWPLATLSLAVLYGVLRQSACWRESAWLGFAWGLGSFLAGVSWVFVSLHDFGGMPAPLALLATGLFCAYLAFFPSLAAALFHWLGGARGRSGVYLFAALWASSEWLRGTLFTGFSWLSTGYAHTPPSPLAGFAPVFGVLGLSLCNALAAAWLARVWAGWREGRRRWLKPALAVLLLLGSGVFLHQIPWTQPTERTLKVSLLQGNIAQAIKWESGQLEHSLRTYLDLAREWPADIVVLPETAIPLLLHQIPDHYLAQLRQSARGVLLGAVTQDGQGRYYNSVIETGSGQTYSKSHLVPFGEFTPPLFGWTLSLLSIPLSDMGRGAPVQPPLKVAGETLAMNICYEDAFGSELVEAARQATLLVNVSNTAWFGHSLAQPQHLQIARVRAMELGRPMLRATNTGMTAAIAPDGDVVAVLPPFVSAALRVTLSGYHGATPYMLWRDWPVLIFAAVVAAVAAFRRCSAESR